MRNEDKSDKKQLENRWDSQIVAHRMAEADEFIRLRSMSIPERARLIEAACRAAAGLMRDRSAAGALPVQPIPWPQSTWDFLKHHAARVRNQSSS